MTSSASFQHDAQDEELLEVGDGDAASLHDDADGKVVAAEKEVYYEGPSDLDCGDEISGAAPSRPSWADYEFSDECAAFVGAGDPAHGGECHVSPDNLTEGDTAATSTCQAHVSTGLSSSPGMSKPVVSHATAKRTGKGGKKKKQKGMPQSARQPLDGSAGDFEDFEGDFKDHPNFARLKVIVDEMSAANKRGEQSGAAADLLCDEFVRLA